MRITRIGGFDNFGYTYGGVYFPTLLRSVPTALTISRELYFGILQHPTTRERFTRGSARYFTLFDWGRCQSRHGAITKAAYVATNLLGDAGPSTVKSQKSKVKRTESIRVFTAVIKRSVECLDIRDICRVLQVLES